ncbi:MAG: RagB/SusD family nutrient uptake outer membrane protein [Prevotella sp.]
MNVKYILSSLVVASMAFASCTDLDTAPEGATITSEQKSEILAALPERGEAGVRGIFSGMTEYLPNYTAFGGSRHNDFGFVSVLYLTDANSEDVSSSTSGYNWAGSSLVFSDRIYTSYESQIVWNDHYMIIYAANNVIEGYSEDPTDEEGMFFLAQGLGARAYMYFSLAQLYQFTYKGNESKPCVPLITDANREEAAKNGAPRNTVEEVYTQIKADIDKAITLLEGTKYARKDKRYISLAVAYGIRARVNLVMQNWSAAAADAEAAIKAAATEKITPATIATVSGPYFANSTESDWMWGALVAETDDVVSSGIVNWISHVGTFNYGYAQYSGGRQINKKLYEQIPDTDVRKAWWSNEDGQNIYLSEAYNQYLSDYSFPAYTSCKFNTYNGLLECDVNANDIPLMRIEEMYLIQAEALAMSGQDGKTVLEKFVKTYRNPSYSCSGNVQDEVFFQRRIELWGEGLIWYDYMRLNKGLDRRGGAFDPTAVFYIQPNDPILLWRLPQTEIQANPALTDADNNETVPAPSPVADN